MSTPLSPSTVFFQQVSVCRSVSPSDLSFGPKTRRVRSENKDPEVDGSGKRSTFEEGPVKKDVRDLML